MPAVREITLRDLLTHTAGLANGFAGPAGEYVRSANLLAGGSLDERVRRAATLPLNFQPGTQWEYSGFAGFDALGRVIELVSGMTLEEFFQRRIFTPLGMKDTYFTVPADRAGDVATSYDKTRSWPQETDARTRCRRELGTVLLRLLGAHRLGGATTCVQPDAAERR